jgi:hypothetical protein
MFGQIPVCRRSSRGYPLDVGAGRIAVANEE